MTSKKNQSTVDMSGRLKREMLNIDQEIEADIKLKGGRATERCSRYTSAGPTIIQRQNYLYELEKEINKWTYEDPKRLDCDIGRNKIVEREVGKLRRIINLLEDEDWL